MAQNERGKSSHPRRNANVPRKQKSNKPSSTNRTVLIVCICAVVVLALLVGIVFGIISIINNSKKDDKILNNVTAGGVNLGGMTVEEAKNALHLATDNTFSKQNMVVKLPDATIILSPADTGAKLDVDAVVEAAFAYGRTGTEEEQEAIRNNAATSIHTIALLPYLNLRLPYIQKTIQDFCNSYSSVMTQPKVELSGDRPVYVIPEPEPEPDPDLDPDLNPDLTPEKPEPIPPTYDHQTLTITMGTPNYILNPQTLYNRVLDSYSLNELEMSYQAPTLTEPQKPNALSIFNQFCVWPEDAVMDEITFEVTPEVYGYGFDVEAVQKMIDNAAYGQTITLDLDFIMPRITARDLTKDLFLDMIASSFTSSNMGAAWNKNLQLSCAAINNYVIKAGEEFSFNLVTGRPSSDKGYLKAPGYRSGKDAEIMGSGVSQTASALYYCLLQADLEIIERHSSGYAPNYADRGMDAYVNWGSLDLRFRNNTDSPIRIVATAEGGTVMVQLYGIDSLSYDVQLQAETTVETAPKTVYQLMDRFNILGYGDNHVLQTGITGYVVNTYMLRYDKETGILISKTQITVSSYASRDQILVKLAPTVSPPVVPTDPVVPSDPLPPAA